MAGEKVAVALSGGMDSAVCAALLLKKGYQVLGVTMHLTRSAATSPVDRAHSIAARLGIPHYVVDFSSEFEDKVIDPFCLQYSSGETPNPCVACNRDLKFGLLLDHIKKLGARFLATGHYARIYGNGSEYHLCKAYDTFKDQTYFLYTLKPDILPSVLFPIGGLLKQEVAKLADDYSLPVSVDDESHDICFMGGANYRSALGSRISTPPGKVYDISGKEAGTHSGISNYTIGQRHGLNLGQPERLYVIRIDRDTNSIIVGPESCLEKKSLIAGSINWISGSFPGDRLNITAKIRYGSTETPVSLSPCGDNLEVLFSSPVKAVSPGQSIVFYSGDDVLGGGIIHS
ncbi:MAG: tRNA 2-thiouridine(34) synthase MnmA [Dehalococcoidales bacterium]|jgi:tRNA-specific 2-thiouridylase|nr:tRNA 2-thiouridine(34) synthase MnmA [Dehalococcoidales bacterium]MDD4230471.1 tRNA 2-thiouridine(34) synthase MnmA [Dehalococcoidales bacterium]MDD4465599.1 tRNA 2-thiouridine(34) synthase MnmA [Dehalococcoidales bacterium]MDD5402280.1 tRNA 2-thiouridine(34) synthase MnmA [Dehalococcoidales bacterium]